VVLRTAAAGGPQAVHEDGPDAVRGVRECLAWWNDREENARAYPVPAAELLANGYNLDRKNPNAKPDAEHLPPEQLVESILAKESKIAAIVGEIKSLLARPQ
jgi:type I restriction enzyme M protein